MAYGHYYPSHKKRLHLFAQKGDTRASKYLQLATPVCSASGIDITFEEVLHTSNASATEDEGSVKDVLSGSNDLWVVAHGTDASTEDPTVMASIPHIPTRGRGPYKKKMPRTVTPDERDGVIEMVEAIGEAYRRAQIRGPEDPVYLYMKLPRYRHSTLSMVRFLQKNDDEFRPGAWFVKSKYVTVQNPTTFNKVIDRVEQQVNGFKWASWY